MTSKETIFDEPVSNFHFDYEIVGDDIKIVMWFGADKADIKETTIPLNAFIAESIADAFMINKVRSVVGCRVHMKDEGKKE